MSMHEQWTDRFSEYLDGELSDAGRRAIDAHLLECADCARTLEELRQVVAAARALPSTTPTSDLWGGISGRLDRARRQHLPAEAGPRPRAFALRVPQLAAAAVLLALLSGWLGTRLLTPAANRAAGSAAATNGPGGGSNAGMQPVSFDETQYDAAVAELQQALQKERARLDPATIATVEENLRVIDAAVDEARHALASDPGSGYLTGHLAQTRSRKLALLRRATAAAEGLN